MEAITPNFLSQESEYAEKRLRQLVEIGNNLGVEIIDLKASKQEIIEAIKHKLPNRYDLVIEKLKNEGLKLEDLSKDLLLDRILGIDILFSFRGKIYSADVTTGKNTAIYNKKKKISEMEPVYKQLGINKALILRIKNNITEDTFLDLFSRLENLDSNDFSTIVLKY